MKADQLDCFFGTELRSTKITYMGLDPSWRCRELSSFWVPASDRQFAREENDLIQFNAGYDSSNWAHFIDEAVFIQWLQQLCIIIVGLTLSVVRKMCTKILSIQLARKATAVNLHCYHLMDTKQLFYVCL